MRLPLTDSDPVIAVAPPSVYVPVTVTFGETPPITVPVPLRFTVPVPAVPFRGTQETELDRLKARLLQEWLAQTADEQLYAPLRRAANEAAGLAWFTPFPLLFFPALLEEKARTAQRQQARQQQIRRRSRQWLQTVTE